MVTIWRSLVEDWNQNKIRIDNFTRHNAGVGIGDTVKVLNITDEVEAKRIVLAPLKGSPDLMPNVVAELIDFPIVKNDIVPISITDPFNQPQIVAFEIVEIEPEEAVVTTKNTLVELLRNAPRRIRRVKRILIREYWGIG